jgi:Domain of unknown function (DUF4136)
MRNPRTGPFPAKSSMLCVVAALAACASSPLKVRSNVDPAANFAGYRTYAFAADPGTNRGGKPTALTIHFMKAISHEMGSRGYQYTEESPDLQVNFNANPSPGRDEETRVAPAYGYSGYYGYRAGLYGLPVLGVHDQVETVTYRVGTGNVDIVDARRKMLIWEGIAEGRLTEEMLADPGPAIATAVKDMFTQYPGKAAP